MAIRDNQLDDAIALVLETQTIVSTRQKAAVWEQVRAQATQQTILVPYAIPPSPPTPRRAQRYQTVTTVLRGIVTWLIDDRVYHRAAAKRHIVGLTHTIGSELVVHYDLLRPIGHYAT